jgi:hypothetical protein
MRTRTHATASGIPTRTHTTTRSNKIRSIQKYKSHRGARASPTPRSSPPAAHAQSRRRAPPRGRLWRHQPPVAEALLVVRRVCEAAPRLTSQRRSSASAAPRHAAPRDIGYIARHRLCATHSPASAEPGARAADRSSPAAAAPAAASTTSAPRVGAAGAAPAAIHSSTAATVPTVHARAPSAALRRASTSPYIYIVHTV